MDKYCTYVCSTVQYSGSLIQYSSAPFRLWSGQPAFDSQHAPHLGEAKVPFLSFFETLPYYCLTNFTYSPMDN